MSILVNKYPERNFSYDHAQYGMIINLYFSPLLKQILENLVLEVDFP